LGTLVTVPKESFACPIKTKLVGLLIQLFPNWEEKLRFFKAAAPYCGAGQIKRFSGKKNRSGGGALGAPEGRARRSAARAFTFFAKPQLVKLGFMSPDAWLLGWLVLFPEKAEKISNQANRGDIGDKIGTVRDRVEPR
jgi:hypothetical protein